MKVTLDLRHVVVCLLCAVAGYLMGRAANAEPEWKYGTDAVHQDPMRYSPSTGERQVLTVDGWTKVVAGNFQFVPEPR